jgi:hypothetical protein
MVDVTLDAVLKLYGSVKRAQAQGTGFFPFGQAGAASARINPRIGQIAAAATAPVSHILFDQLVTGSLIGQRSLTLVENVCIRRHAPARQIANYGLGAATDFTWWIQIFYTQEPQTMFFAGINKTGQCGNQRAEVQVASG